MTQAFGLIIIGDEILSGKRADKHLPKVIELLAQRGLSLSYADYVGDDPARITATLARAFAAARETGDVVFSTGGIGATPDDHTRQCAAQALGLELALHPEAKVLIEERMRDTAKEQNQVFEPYRHDNLHRLNMGVFPVGAHIIPNPYNKIPGFSCFVERGGELTQAGAAEPGQPGHRRSSPLGGQQTTPSGERGGIHFLPGFPVMAWPMIEWVLDHHYAFLHQATPDIEKSVIVPGAIEATLTPLMLAIEATYIGVKVFSLPSVDHPEFGRHIELGVKGTPERVEPAYAALLDGLKAFNLKLGPELVR